MSYKFYKFIYCFCLILIPSVFNFLKHLLILYVLDISYNNISLSNAFSCCISLYLLQIILSMDLLKIGNSGTWITGFFIRNVEFLTQCFGSLEPSSGAQKWAETLGFLFSNSSDWNPDYQQIPQYQSGWTIILFTVDSCIECHYCLVLSMYIGSDINFPWFELSNALL